MDRRDFVKTSCLACGMLAIGSLLTACATSGSMYKTAVVNNLVTVPLTSFPADGKAMVVRAEGLPYDILLVNKTAEADYIALYMQCTHRDAPVQQTGNGFACNEHGSQFDKTGQVVKGPARRPMKKFNVTPSGENVVIQVT